MRKILVLFLLPLAFSACKHDPLVTHHGFRVEITGDLDTPFSKSGETRQIEISFLQERYEYNQPTEKWDAVPVTVVKIYDESGQFRIENRRLSGKKMIVDLVAEENISPEVIYAQLGFFLEEDVYLDSDSALATQEAAEISREYRVITTGPNPFVIPAQEGGTFDIPFTVECCTTINGVQGEWTSQDLYGLYYQNNCFGAASHHTLEIKPGEEEGQYYFHITARPYYLEDERVPMLWLCFIYAANVDGWRFEQKFLHEQDRSLAGSEEPASGNDFSGGYLNRDRH